MASAVGNQRNQSEGKTGEAAASGMAEFLPAEVLPLNNPQTDLPRIAKDERLIRLIEQAIQQIPTRHTINLGDARGMAGIEPESVHLVMTSPPYWTLKEYRKSDGQMGHIEDYEEFLDELDKVWSRCWRMLVPGGRLVCVVGDVCLSRAERTMGGIRLFRCMPPFKSAAANSASTTWRPSSGTRLRTPPTKWRAAAPVSLVSHTNQMPSSRTISSSSSWNENRVDIGPRMFRRGC